MNSHRGAWKAALLVSSFLAVTLSAPPLGTPPLGAQPAIPTYAPPLTGHVTNGRSGGPAAGALVMVFRRGEMLDEARVAGNGDFKVTRIPADVSGPYAVVARLPQANPAVAPIVTITSPEGNKLLDITLPASEPLRVKITDTAGHPLADATITATVVEYTKMDAGMRMPIGTRIPWEYKGEPISGTNVSGADGAASILELPHDAAIHLLAKKKGFADTVAKIRVPSKDEVLLKLARPAIVEGTVMLNEDEPLAVPEWRMKMQGWRAPWSEWDNFRMGNFDAKGHYEIRNVTSLEVLGEPTYGINIDIGDATHPAPDITGTYVPPNGGGWDLMVTVTRNGKTERYISFVEAANKGLKFAEGARVRRDVMLVPMALVKGTMPPSLPPDATVSYRDKRSIYGPWFVHAKANGHFEIPVPVGDVKLNIANRVVAVTDLKPQEVRVITVPDAESPAKANP